MDKIKVVILSNGELQVKEIVNTLEELQGIVGGYIEMPFLGGIFNKHKINPIVNEEGKFIKSLNPEIALIDSNTNKVLDVVYGNCVFTSHDIHGETISLNDEQIKVVMEELKQEVTLNYNDSKKQHTVRALFIWRIDRKYLKENNKTTWHSS